MFHAANHAGFKNRPIAAVLVAALSLPALAAKIESGTEPVSVYLNVETKGKLVTGLTKENFRLYEDGKPQAFRLETPEEPASVAVLVEYSSASAYFLDDLNAAMEGFLKHAPEGHWYALATFAKDLEVQRDFTKQTGEITAAYSQLGVPMWSEINTYDAVYETLDKLGRLPGRRILIIVGSGFDTFSEHTLDDVKKKAEAGNVTIFVAGLGSLFRGAYEMYLSESSRLSLVQAQVFLQMLAKKTGGYAWFPNQFHAFPDVLEGIMQSVAAQYRLVYERPLSSSGKFRKLKVEAFRIVNDKRENFDVLVREGWR